MTPAVPFRELDAEQQAHLDEIGARVSNLYRVLAHRPPLLRAWVDFAWTLRGQALTPRALRELMILRCAQLSGADYQWADHVVMARAAGVDEERIDALVGWRSSGAFDEQQRAVLAFTDEVVAGTVSDATLGALQERFTPPEVVELTLTASFYVMVPRVLDALRVPHGGRVG